jgi:hypothetical protein
MKTRLSRINCSKPFYLPCELVLHHRACHPFFLTMVVTTPSCCVSKTTAPVDVEMEIVAGSACSSEREARRLFASETKPLQKPELCAFMPWPVQKEQEAEHKRQPENMACGKANAHRILAIALPALSDINTPDTVGSEVLHIHTETSAHRRHSKGVSRAFASAATVRA